MCYEASIFHLPYSIFHMSYSIFHIPYSIFHIPYSIFHIPYSIFHIPYSIFHIPYSIFHIPYDIWSLKNKCNQGKGDSLWSADAWDSAGKLSGSLAPEARDVYRTLRKISSSSVAISSTCRYGAR